MKRRKSNIKNVELTVIITDRSRYLNDLWSQLGLSIMIDCSWENGQKRRILFDTGWEPEPLIRNMKKMNINIDSIDAVVLSHCHYDHTGGLKALIKNKNGRFKLIAHRDIIRPVYSLKPEIHYIGVDEKLLLGLPKERIMLLSEDIEIYEGIKITGTIPRITDFEKPEEDVYILKDGELIPDSEEDDMALVFDFGEKGIVVISGCSHAGIINTLYQSMKVMNNNKILGVIGGFHLVDLSEDTRLQTVEALSNMEIGSVWTGHCTGYEAEFLIKDKLGKRHEMFYTGDKITFD